MDDDGAAESGEVGGVFLEGLEEQLIVIDPVELSHGLQSVVELTKLVVIPLS